MQQQIEKLIQDIKNDYVRFMSNVGDKADIRQDMIDNFVDNVTYNEGKKYIKILKKLGTQTMVWGFIVNVDNDAKFRKGDILMAAGFNAPARNKPRGNVLDGEYTIRWTGPEYLK
jgi:TATA-binding protein-associated factor Taf7